MSFVDGIKKVSKQSIIALDVYYKLYIKLSNYLDFKKISYSKEICSGDIIYDHSRMENEFLKKVKKTYEDLWVFDKLKISNENGIKIGSSCVNQELTLKYNSVAKWKIDDNKIKFIRINPSKEIKMYKHKRIYDKYIYLLPTNYEKIYVFITKADSILWYINRGKTTFMDEIQILLREVEIMDSYHHDNFLWIPFFKKVVEPYDLTDFLYTFSNSDKIDIKSAVSSFSLEISGDVIDKGFTMKPESKSQVFDDDFIFGFVQSDIENILDIPLCAVIVEKSDF